jgi:hypothetical protein
MTENQKTQPIELTPVVPVPLDLLQRAITADVRIEVIERLVSLHERAEEARARRSFSAAMSAAKAKIRPIIKTQRVDYATKAGRTRYDYESLGDISDAVDPILSEHGLSYRYRSSQNGQRLAVTCILEHSDGYSETTTLECAEDQGSGKNAIQALGSAVTYLQRYTLKLALGLATAKDDDGRATSQRTSPETQQPQPRPILIDWLGGKGRQPWTGSPDALLEQIHTASLRAMAAGDVSSVSKFRAANAAELRRMSKSATADQRDALIKISALFSRADEAVSAERQKEEGCND